MILVRLLFFLAIGAVAVAVNTRYKSGEIADVVLGFDATDPVARAMHALINHSAETAFARKAGKTLRTRRSRSSPKSRNVEERKTRTERDWGSDMGVPFVGHLTREPWSAHEGYLPSLARITL